MTTDRSAKSSNQETNPSNEVARRRRKRPNPRRAWWIGLTAASLSSCTDADPVEPIVYANPPSWESDEEKQAASAKRSAAAAPSSSAPQALAKPRPLKLSAASVGPNAKFLDARAQPTATLGVEAAKVDPPSGRVGEMLNQFRYAYPGPEHAALGLLADVAVAPWKASRRLVRIAIKGREATSTSNPAAGESIAKDVSVEVRWNADAVRSYRLVGYEDSAPPAPDSVDGPKAGDIHAGEALTVFYEVEPISQRSAAQGFGSVSIRYKLPTAQDSPPIEVGLRGADTPVAEMSADFRFAVSVIALGMLQDGTFDGTTGIPFEAIEKLAQGALGDDPDGERTAFVGLVRSAKQEHQSIAKPAVPRPPGWWRR